MKHKITVINGPNLNLLGEREKEKYGDISLKKIEAECLGFAAKNNIELTFKQSNIEGEIVGLIQECRNKYSGLIINAAGYTHTSVSILDALMVLKIPIIEHNKPRDARAKGKNMSDSLGPSWSIKARLRVEAIAIEAIIEPQ